MFYPIYLTIHLTDLQILCLTIYVEKLTVTSFTKSFVKNNGESQ